MTRLSPRASRVILLAAASALAACSLDPLPAPEQPPLTAADRGEALFHSPSISASPFNPYACSTCHTAGAASPDGLVRTGAPLAGVVDRPSYWGGSEIDLLRAVNHCLWYFMLHDEPWTGQEPDAQALYAYLETLTAGASSEAAPFTVVELPEDVPDGDAARGLDVYERACATCHGALHTGAGRLVEHAPALPGDVFESHPSPEYTAEERRLVFVFKIRHGGFMGHHGQMPPFSAQALSDADVGDLLAVFFAPP